MTPGHGPRPDPEPLASPYQLHREVARVAAAISARHPEGVTLVAELKASVVFTADLCRLLTVPTRVEFVAVAPFDGSAPRAHLLKDLDGPVVGEQVVLVTGVVDTGLTVDYLRRHLAALGAAGIQVATLADKPVRRLLPITPDHTVVQAPDRFLVGYGLGYAGRYRNVPGLWAVDGVALAEDPDRHVPLLYDRAGPGQEGGHRAPRRR